MLLKLYSALGALQHAVAPQAESIGYWERQALGALGAQSHRIATPEQDSEILGQIQHIYDIEGMPQKPKVIIYKQDVPNAAFIHTGTIVISTGLLKRLDRDEREGVLAHEITHQQQNKVNLGAFFATSLGTLWAADGITKKVMDKVPSRFGSPMLNYLTFGLATYVGSFLTNIPFAAFTRQQELKADAGAAWITRKPEKLASALQKLEHYPQERGKKNKIPKTDGALPAAALHSNAAEETTHKSGWKQLKKRLYATHPDTPERIAQLKEIEAEQKRMGVHSSQTRKVEGQHSARVIQLSAESHASSSQQRA